MALSLTLPLLLAAAQASPQASPLAEVDVLDLLPDRAAARREAAFAAVGASEDEAFTAPLLDLLALARTAEEWYRIVDALGALHGEDVRATERPWRTWSLRRAEDPDRDVPDGYAEFKARLFASALDPAFERFLGAERTATVPLDEVVWGGVVVDGIPALDDPEAVPAAEPTFLTDDDPVFGITLGGESRAYPTRILDWHEMVNDVVGSVPFSLTWCTLCGAPVPYRGLLDGERVTFGSSGMLWRSNKLMYDRGTDTLWNQATGRAVIGPLAGQGVQLEVLPVRTTTWGAWRRAHPSTTVVTPRTGHDRDYTPGAAYGDYFASAETMFPTPGLGATYRPKERIVIVRRGGDAASVSLDRVERTGAVTLDLAGRPVVVVTPRATGPARLPKAWSIAIEEGGGDPLRPSASDLAAAVRAASGTLPELDVDAVVSLPRPTRRELLGGRIEGIALFPSVRDRAAVRHLVGDARAYAADGLDLAPARVSAEIGGEPSAQDAPTLVDQDGRSWKAEEDGLVADDGGRRDRVPSHLAFGFAWDAHFAR
ncbi:MAG: DUF3179 domain-containing protein [Planctomycetota bacterium]